VFIAALLLLGAAALFSGCYTLKQGTTMLGYLGQAVPLEALGEEDRLFVERVESIRRFALEELGLKQSKNYTRYVKLDRDYLAAVVSASAKDSFSRHDFWYPVVGKLPYKGFFNVKDARKERVKLEKKGLDVWIRGVDAFSTLGWFKDPLYSYMKNYPDRDLAALIIHELFHATVFLKNHAQFNEELAEFVGTEGGRLYIEKTGLETDSGTDSREDARSDSAAFNTFIRSLIAELDILYKSNTPREEKLLRKDEIIKEAKAKFEKEYDGIFKTPSYKGFIELPVNNAYLGLFMLYHEEDSFYKELYEKSGSDLARFIAAAKTLTTRKGNPKEELEKAYCFSERP
jgi:predicted aminopeptidase